MRGKRHSDELRAAVMGALLAGMNSEEVAKTYKLDSRLVRRWKQEIDRDKLAEVARKREYDFTGLLLECAKAGLESFQAICRTTQEASYIRSQPASELAILAGVQFDKGLRILEAAEEPATNGNQVGQLEAAVIPGADNPGGTKRD